MLVVKNPPANAGDIRDAGSVPRSGRSLEVGNDNSFQYSCLENPVDRRAWQATVCGISESDTTERAHSTHMCSVVWMGFRGLPKFCVHVYAPQKTKTIDL